MILKMDIDAVIQVILDTSKSSSNNVIKMENCVQKLNGYRESSSEVRDEIIALIPENEIAEEAQRWIDYQRAIDNALDIAQEYISKQSISKVDEQTTSGSIEHKQSHLKLPKLELPKFDGVVFKFQNFWDQFEVAVHNNDNVPAVQKFTYLRSVLEGIAYQTIEGFEVTSANYHHAVDALKHRFGRKRIIILSLVKSIVQLEPRSNKGVASLRDLHDTLKNRIRALEALGEKPMTHSCILLPILEAKLPPELSEKWELELTDIKEESVDLELFFKFLNKQVISNEAGERNASVIGEDVYHSQTGGIVRGNAGWDKNGTGIKNTREKTFTAAGLMASGMNQSSNAVCNLCKQQGHETLKCPELKRGSIEERWQLVRENRLCFNCLKPASTFHYSSVCRQPKCSIEGCGRRHHAMLHGDGDRSTEGQRQTTLSGFVSSYSPKMQQALLQTGTATLVADGDQRVNVRVLFDSGSQRSYINKNVPESLALDGPSEVLSVSMLGGGGGGIQSDEKDEGSQLLPHLCSRKRFKGS